MMNSCERVLATLRGEKADRVPLYDYLFQKELFAELTGVHPGAYDLCQALDCAKALHHDMAAGFIGTDENFEAVMDENGQYADEFGTVFMRTEASWPIDAPIRFPVSDWTSYKRLKYPDPTARGRLTGLKAGLEKNRGELAISAGVEGPFTRLWMLFGPEELLVQMHTEPEFIKTVFSDITDYLIALAQHIESAEPHVFAIAEDLGASAGPFLSLPMFEEFVLPPLERLVKAVKLPIFFHSCGNINLYLRDLADLGIAAIHPLQRTANMSLRDVKEQFGDRLTIVGNVDSSTTLPYGTPDDVERETRECLDIAKAGGRYILASDHSLHDGIPVANIRRMFETGLRLGAY